MSNQATGTFEVRFEPLPSADGTFGRMRIIKDFSGDLTGYGLGEMLSVGSSRDDSAAYVALDQITGTLHGRKGSFSLVHTGVMTRGDGQLSVVVVPDSGTDELAGLTGTLTIVNDSGAHSYVLDYDLS